MIVDGVEYVKKEDFKLKDYYIMDRANVMAIVPIKEDVREEKIIQVGDVGKFKLFEGDISFHKINMKNFKAKVFGLGKSRYSMEYLEIARKTAKPFYGSEEPIFFKMVGEDDFFIEDSPCLINFGDMFFLLAPRIDDEVKE